MKSMKKAVALALMSIAAAGSFAATQGNPSTTQSIATYQNTFGVPAVTPEIRIFGVQDTLHNQNAGIVANNFSANDRGTENGFCVAHSTGGGVQLVLTNANGAGNSAAAAGSFRARDAATGGTLNYFVSFRVGAGAPFQVQPAGTIIFPAGTTQADLLSCTTPNVFKNVFLEAGAAGPAAGSFVDVVTLTATPL
jgi:hypothetical protein